MRVEDCHNALMPRAKELPKSVAQRRRNPPDVKIISRCVNPDYAVSAALASFFFESRPLIVWNAGEVNVLIAHSARTISWTKTPQTASPAIVIGFLGGLLPPDDPIRSEVKLAERLRGEHLESVCVETFENRRHKDAHRMILGVLDGDEAGVPSEDEKRGARIILYGHSWGGAAVVRLAEELEKDGIPVLLTVQVDSVGRRDDVIPCNVRRAVNFYQPNGLIRGCARIRAADPAQTEILGNFHMEYKSRAVDCSELPWYERALAKTHTAIACDPGVWVQVHALIREELDKSEK